MSLRASFVRTAGERDRIYVTRTDGSTTSWVFPSYGDVLPHDLVHLAVESAFGVARGFWGRVDGGADPGAIAREANRRGGRDKYAAYGADQAELLLAESLANVRWLEEGASASALVEQAAAACRAAGLVPPATVAPQRVEELRSTLGGLSRRWRALVPKGATDVIFDPRDLQRGFARLANGSGTNSGLNDLAR
jgi:hypothetical protein